MLDLDVVKEKIICIYGPTASYKSNFAVSLAQKISGVVINADSMQVYKCVPILTSQPDHQERATIEHRLYGIIDPISYFSVNSWLKIVVDIISDVRRQGLHPILVGGTGLYFSSLINGIAKIPTITQVTKDKLKNFIKQPDNKILYNLLQKYDSKLAKKLNCNDRVRILRGLEVIIQTGKSILDWQNKNTIFFKKLEFFNIYICPPRDMLYNNINQRFLKMLNMGVESEVKNIIENYDRTKLPKIIGLSSIVNYILGKKSFDEMINNVQQFTRNYAKRQYTWFNNQLEHNFIVDSYKGEGV